MSNLFVHFPSFFLLLQLALFQEMEENPIGWNTEYIPCIWRPVYVQGTHTHLLRKGQPATSVQSNRNENFMSPRIFFGFVQSLFFVEFHLPLVGKFNLSIVCLWTRGRGVAASVRDTVNKVSSGRSERVYLDGCLATSPLDYYFVMINWLRICKSL